MAAGMDVEDIRFLRLCLLGRLRLSNAQLEEELELFFSRALAPVQSALTGLAYMFNVTSTLPARLLCVSLLLLRADPIDGVPCGRLGVFPRACVFGGWKQGLYVAKIGRSMRLVLYA